VFPARRIVDFCVTDGDHPPTCGNELASKQPKMDLGIYEYEAIGFVMDADGHYSAKSTTAMNLIGQANRARPGQLFGDGYFALVSPFDRGIENGRFRSTDGSLSECPEHFGCGLQIAISKHTKKADRSDAPLDTVASIRRGPDDSTAWAIYPISNKERSLYSVPPLGSPDRFVEIGSYYFTSSMYAVGEQTTVAGGHRTEARFEYGGGLYNGQGRGFEGFKWIVAHDVSAGLKFGTWWRQATPYTGVLERSWTEKESDHENDYLHGSPGRDYVKFEQFDLKCYGPPGSPVSKRAECEPSKDGAFHVVKTPHQR